MIRLLSVYRTHNTAESEQSAPAIFIIGFVTIFAHITLYIVSIQGIDIYLLSSSLLHSPNYFYALHVSSGDI